MIMAIYARCSGDKQDESSITGKGETAERDGALSARQFQQHASVLGRRNIQNPPADLNIFQISLEKRRTNRRKIGLAKDAQRRERHDPNPKEIRM